MTTTKGFGTVTNPDSANITTSIVKWFKTVYKDDDLADHSATQCAAYDSIKVEDFYGANFTFPVVLADASGIGSTRQAAADAARAGLAETWVVSDVYSLFKRMTWDWQTMKRLANSSGSYIDVVQRDIGKAITSMKTELSRQFWGDSAGDLGQIKGLAAPHTAAASFTVTLVNKDHMFKFSLNQIYDFWSTRTSGAGVQRGDAGVTAFKLTAMNHNTGELTFLPVVKTTDVAQTNVSAGTERISDGFALDVPADYIFASGTRNSFPYGIRTYIPDTDAEVAASPTLFGVDRTRHYSALAGTRSAWQGTYMDSIRELVLRMNYTTAQQVSSVVWMNPRDFQGFLQECEQNGAPPVRDEAFSMRLGVTAIQVNTPKGKVRVAADMFLDAGRMYLLEMNALRLLAVGGKLISEINDGLSMPRLTAAEGDGNYMELRSYTQTVLTRPINCGVVVIPTAA